MKQGGATVMVEHRVLRILCSNGQQNDLSGGSFFNN